MHLEPAQIIEPLPANVADVDHVLSLMPLQMSLVVTDALVAQVTVDRLVMMLLVRGQRLLQQGFRTKVTLDDLVLFLALFDVIF